MNFPILVQSTATAFSGVRWMADLPRGVYRKSLSDIQAFVTPLLAQDALQCSYDIFAMWGDIQNIVATSWRYRQISCTNKFSCLLDSNQLSSLAHIQLLVSEFVSITERAGGVLVYNIEKTVMDDLQSSMLLLMPISQNNNQKFVSEKRCDKNAGI
ncbi:hypothetical protein AVEN_131302-1 [Araneus ventricosus]|uniref:Uncharacterized protein n=1 Tax=Araneus ventricosus TaxID=182803 RepID=A0A4Y2W7W6_ARAVE|nr:hypothetical protein AVEN_131302-1 [Araneus ventricosus]